MFASAWLKHVNAVFRTHDESAVRLLFKTGFKKRDGVATLSPRAHGVNQGEHGLSWREPKKSRNRMVARSLSTTSTEALFLPNEETGDAVQTVVIVGAGIAGLSAAVALQKSVIISSQEPDLELCLEANPHVMIKTICSRLQSTSINLVSERFCRLGRRIRRLFHVGNIEIDCLSMICVRHELSYWEILWRRVENCHRFMLETLNV